MRKRLLGQDDQHTAPIEKDWLDLENLAQAELTSEDAAHPIESALKPNAGPGWRASEPGAQTVRLLFDAPVRVTHVRLVFDEDAHARTQEFVLRWSADSGQSFHEIVRQQYNFSPPDTSQQQEDLAVDLDGVTVLELRIIPDVSGGGAHASISQLRIA